MPCAEGKDTYPDLQTALIVRDNLIKRYGVPMLAYKCLGGCLKWHLTTKWKSDQRIKKWNNIATESSEISYWKMVLKANPNLKTITDIRVSGKYLLCRTS